MNLFSRLRIRISDEGIFKTLFYIIYAAFYCTREFIFNFCFDIKYSGKFLNGNIKTTHKNLGANDIYHTKYSVLTKIFRLVPIYKEDVLVDVGCGKGRVINYWLSRKLNNKIIGLELDKSVAKKTAAHLSRWKNVAIISGNAINNIPEEGTLFYFYNPFSEEMVKQFEEKMLLLFKNKPIRIIYYNPKSIHVFQNGNWKIRFINFDNDLGYKKWGRINKYHDLAIIKNKV